MARYKTAKELREEAKQGNIQYYQRLAKLFQNHASIELSEEMAKIADVLHRAYGLTYEEIEQLEIEG